MKLLYSIGIWIYYAGALVMSLWDEKARLWLQGRKQWTTRLDGVFKDTDRVIWFHCASLGEFEQGRPVIEEARRRCPEKKILLTFFSPSGYEKRKDYGEVDHVCYLPLDTPGNARKFLDIVPLEKVVFIKYEFWYFFLNGIAEKSVPLFLASGKFRKNQIFFRWYGGWYRKVLNSFSHIFVQDEASESLLKTKGVDQVSVAGDTRFDRVAEIARVAKEISEVKEFVGSAKVMIAGSTWEKDEKIIGSLYEEYKDLRWIIAPHEPTESNVERLKQWFPEHVLFSELQQGRKSDASVLIVNTIGHLSSLYKYADIAYIGGGFGKGIHNILEASAAGLPVLFGPRYLDFGEAVDLHELGGAFEINNEQDAIMIMSKLLNANDYYLRSSEISSTYISDSVGATKFILDRIF